MTTLADLRCDVCGSPDLIAIAPGHAAVSCSLFDTLPERPMRGWCAEHWRSASFVPRETRMTGDRAGIEGATSND